MSPITRKIVALGLVILTGLLGIQLLILPLLQAIADQRDELAALRSRRIHLAASAHRLMPDASTIPLGLAIVASNAHDASKRLQALLTGSASVAGVALTQGGVHTDETRLLGSDVVVTGTEVGLTKFVSLVEHGSPAIRFRHWQLTAGDAPSAMRFDGLAIAVWQPSR